ncbi:MAG TPA: hypothetical protein VFH99_00450 [Candidatus Saccharimonadales bacterium]|nr:hypothetical protein [Candidatus Saccharimonadales bacterium]
MGQTAQAQAGAELSSRIFETLQASEVSRQEDIRVANSKDISRAHHFTSQIADVKHIEGIDPMDLTFEIISLHALIPDILARKKIADRATEETGETVPIGPIEYKSGSIRHYAGALLIASQALDRPIRAKAGEETALINPNDTREVAKDACRQLWPLSSREI